MVLPFKTEARFKDGNGTKDHPFVLDGTLVSGGSDDDDEIELEELEIELDDIELELDDREIKLDDVEGGELELSDGPSDVIWLNGG